MAEDNVLDALHACHDSLAEVRRPTLVHTDLWHGNVFGGDPVSDLNAFTLLREVDEDDGLLEGYRAAGGVLELTPAVRQRLALYRVYLDLVMLVEWVPRGYDAHERAGWNARVTQHLREQLPLAGLRALQ